MQKVDIAVTGAGASGLIAAIIAARAGVSVALLERMDRVGKKILATGNGRCNLTNTFCEPARYHGADPDFAMKVINKASPQFIIDFFKEIGLLCTTEDEGRVYPLCGQASAVLDVLRFEAERLGIVTLCEFAVKAITPENGGFIISSQQGKKITCLKVIVATGGMASPQFGSNGSGYGILKALHHTCTGLFPALVQLRLDAPGLKQLDGARCDAGVILRNDRTALSQDRGEILFTDYGISGIPVFQVSRMAGAQLEMNKKVFLEVDLFPQFTQDGVLALIEQRIQARPSQPVEQNSIGMFHKKLIRPILAASGIRPDGTLSNELTKDEIGRVVSTSKAWRFSVKGTQSWAHAQVTAGGIATAEINPDTMESTIVPGLYCAGEILDIDGDCGGYNLQWAWASGYCAGKAATEAVKR